LKLLNLSKTDTSQSKSEKVMESSEGQSRLIEFVLKRDEGISPHIHPKGEDCALVLEGELTYFLTNKDSIKARSGELVLGYKNVLHGYLNKEDESVHLLIFAAPRDIGLAYPNDDDPIIRNLPVNQRIFNCNDKVSVCSELSSFSTLSVQGVYEEDREEGLFKAFINIADKEIYVFDNESVRLETREARRFLKYTAHI
jgi:quercetin dioxygenase-like cupin family protein